MWKGAPRHSSSGKCKSRQCLLSEPPPAPTLHSWFSWALLCSPQHAYPSNILPRMSLAPQEQRDLCLSGLCLADSLGQCLAHSRASGTVDEQLLVLHEMVLFVVSLLGECLWPPEPQGPWCVLAESLPPTPACPPWELYQLFGGCICQSHA